MAARSSRRSSRGSAIRVDFSGVETLERFKEEGDYLLEVAEVTKEKGDKGDYLNWKITSVNDPEGAIVYNNTSLTPQSLWNLKAFLEALGVEVPDDEMDLDLSEYVGLQFMGSIGLESFEGKKRPRLEDFWAAEEEEEAKPKKKGAGKSPKKDEEEEEEKPSRSKRGSAKSSKKKQSASVSEDDINDMDQEELQDLIDEHDLEVDLDELKSLRKMRAAVIEAATEADILSGDAEDEPEEEEEKPVRKGRASRSSKDEEEEEEEEEKPVRRRRSRR